VATRRSSLGVEVACPQDGQNLEPSGTAAPHDPHIIRPAYGASATAHLLIAGPV